MKKETINIAYNCKEPINDLNLERRLSNLYNYKFRMGGCEFESWEGFIQSLKMKNPYNKMASWTKYGYAAWKGGQDYNWQETQILYWGGKEINRQSEDYDNLITESYDALYEQNEEFRNILSESMPYNIVHKMGHSDKYRTLLTKEEYIGHLERLRGNKKSRKFSNLLDLFR